MTFPIYYHYVMTKGPGEVSVYERRLCSIVQVHSCRVSAHHSSLLWLYIRATCHVQFGRVPLQSCEWKNCVGCMQLSSQAETPERSGLYPRIFAREGLSGSEVHFTPRHRQGRWLVHVSAARHCGQLGSVVRNWISFRITFSDRGGQLPRSGHMP